MKTSKILEILKINPRDGKNGTIYYITLKLENGETISLGKKKENAFAVGQEISYIETVDANGKKKRSEPKKAYGGGAGISNKQIAAIGAAILTAGGKSDFKTSADTILNWLEA
jgi:hypothetical protein